MLFPDVATARRISVLLSHLVIGAIGIVSTHGVCGIPENAVIIPALIALSALSHGVWVFVLQTRVGTGFWHFQGIIVLLDVVVVVVVIIGRLECSGIRGTSDKVLLVCETLELYIIFLKK